MDKTVIEAYACTHEGCVRENNEDNYYLFGEYKKDPKQLRASSGRSICEFPAVTAVFDGMGGESDGELAALMAAESVEAYPMREARERIQTGLLSLNDRVCQHMRDSLLRMGTTVALLCFDEGKAICANLGDSRGYLYRNGVLRQLTTDHSEGQQMVDNGLMTEEEARRSKKWHILTQYIGIFPDEFLIEPHFSEEIELSHGDLFLLGSDGLTDVLSDVEIRGILAGAAGGEGVGSLEQTAGLLLNRVLEKKGPDNTTILLVRVIRTGE